MNSTITFVTCLIYKPDTIVLEHIIEQFILLAKTGIFIGVYVSEQYEENLKIRLYLENLENVKILGTREMTTSWISNLCNSQPEPLQLPEQRNPEKDTYDFILESHLKHELLEDACIQNPWNTSHFAWIQFSIFELFRQKEESSEYLKWLTKITLPNKILNFPGCVSKLEKEKIEDVTHRVFWRFCGMYFMGDRDSILDFCALYKTKIPLFFEQYKKLVWDFNIWAWLEAYYEEDWKGTWYRGDHNDSILLYSADYYTRGINVSHKREYDYMKIDTYYPTSACYLYYQGKHWLNTRYVNYWIYPNGGYYFYNPNKIIENKNVLSELDPDSFEPLNYKEILENTGLPQDAHSFSTGLEDIRIYEFRGQVKYIATSVGYSCIGRSRMVVGNYDIEKCEINNGNVIQPPILDGWHEKNWIPLIQSKKDILPDGTIVSEEKEYFIYKWFPLEIGAINYETKQLEIIYRHQINLPIFRRVRGSTMFVEREEGLLGLVHSSEEHSPRHYYHMLVLLDKDDYHLIKYSESFYFEKLGIEFCIGFTIDKNDCDEEEYVFWISRHDRDPLFMCVGMDEIKWV